MGTLRTVFFYILVGVVPLSAQVNHDSLFAIWLDESNHDTVRIKAFTDYYVGKFMTTNMDSARVYAEKHWEFANERGLNRQMGGAKNSLGQIFLNTGKQEEAIEAFEESIKYYEAAGFLKGAAGGHINIGITLNGMGRSDEAIEKYDLGIDICDQIGNIDFKMNGLNNKGVIYLNKGEYDKAIPVFKEVAKVAGKSIPGSDAHKGGLVNLGYALAKKGDHASAIKYLNDCIKLIDKYGGGQVDIYAYNFLGSSYNALGEFDNALTYFEKSYARADSMGNPGAMVAPLSNIADIHKNRGDFKKAKELLFKAAKLAKESNHITMELQSLINLGYIDFDEGELDSSEFRFNKALEGALKVGEFDKQAFAMIGLGKVNLNKGKAKTAQYYYNKAHTIGKDIGDPTIIMGATDGLTKAYKNLGNSQAALDMFEEFVLFKDSIERDENKRAVIHQEFRYAYEKKALADSLDFAQKEAIKDLELEKRNADLAKQRIALAGTGIGILLLILLASSIRRGKKRSDELLHNILPAEVAQELKESGKVSSKRIDQVTVLFTDFKDFTSVAEKLNADQLVEDLHDCFSEFDRIMEKYGIEKIKTIGDSYMAAGGLPVPHNKNARNVIRAALDIRDFIEKGKAKKIESGLPYFEVRIGVHTGPVVAGIVGVKKFQYDIWGDTVNTASRMESSGEEGKVNISDVTYQLIKDDPEFSFSSRGEIETKGKGKINMWFVSRSE